MIIHKQLIDSRHGDGKTLVVSYVNKEGNVDFLQYPIPAEQMFEWKLTNKQNACPAEYMINPDTGEYVFDENGNPKTVQWKSYDNKYVRKDFVKKALSDTRINEILCSFGKRIDPVFEMNIPNMWSCDIETDVDDNGFPVPEEARLPINTISLTKFPRTIVWSRKDLTAEERQWVQEQIDTYSETTAQDPAKRNITKSYKFEFRYFPTEKAMLEDFIEFIKDITAIYGWNFLQFDWVYIYNRCVANMIDIDKLSPTRKQIQFKLKPRVGGHEINLKVPMHKIIFDYMLIIQNWDMTISHAENYKLDYIAERVLSVKKVPHEWGFKEFYENHFKEYVFYNCIDTIIVEQIDKQIATASIWFMLASILRIELNSAYSTMTPAETVLINFVYPQYKVFPNTKKDIPDEQEKYEGAFVWPTKPGIHRYVAGLDFASLYPSIMRQFLISPETFLFKDASYTPKEDEIKTASGAVYKKDENAMIPSVLTHYFGLRKQAKADKKQADAELEVYKEILEARRAAVKQAMG